LGPNPASDQFILSLDDTRTSIILGKSGIVHELVNMMKAGKTDFDRWQGGVKGLLALGLF
jgi:hypothetical protein